MVRPAEVQEFAWGSFVFFGDPEATAGQYNSCLLAISWLDDSSCGH